MIALLFSPVSRFLSSLAVPRWALAALCGVGIIAAVHGGVTIFEDAQHIAVQKAEQAATKRVEAEVAKKSQAVVNERIEKMRDGMNQFSKRQIQIQQDWDRVSDETEKVAPHVDTPEDEPVAPLPPVRADRHETRSRPHVAHPRQGNRRRAVHRKSSAAEHLNRADADADSLLERESVFGRR